MIKITLDALLRCLLELLVAQHDAADATVGRLLGVQVLAVLVHHGLQFLL